MKSSLKLFGFLFGFTILLASMLTAEEFTLTSPAFKDGENLPARYTCDDQNIPPKLEWSGTPEKTQSFALLVEDPDGADKKPYVHWVLFDLPPTIKNIPEGLPAWKILINGERNGTNDSGSLGYSGPCPEDGEHSYVFRLYALDTAFALDPGITSGKLLKAMEGHILAQAELSAKYKRGPSKK